MVHGAGAAQALLQAGQLDQLEIHLVPVLLGAGRRLFEARDSHIELQLIRRLEGRGATHLRSRLSLASTELVERHHVQLAADARKTIQVVRICGHDCAPIALASRGNDRIDDTDPFGRA
jgi:hypothetical protein